MEEGENPVWLHEGCAWQTMPLSWFETDANCVRWEQQIMVSAADLLQWLRSTRAMALPTKATTPEGQ